MSTAFDWIPDNFAVSISQRGTGYAWEATYRDSMFASGETDHCFQAFDLAEEAIEQKQVDLADEKREREAFERDRDAALSEDADDARREELRTRLAFEGKFRVA